MHRSLHRTAALLGALLLFVCGFGWYLSMGLWALPTRAGFQSLAGDPDIQASYSTVAGPHTLSFDFAAPKKLEGEYLYRGEDSTVAVTRVDLLTDTACRIWFRAEGDLTRGGGALVSACLPRVGKGAEASLRSSLVAEPQETCHAYLSNYDTGLGERGNRFAITVLSEETPGGPVDLVFQELQKVTFGPADGDD